MGMLIALDGKSDLDMSYRMQIILLLMILHGIICAQKGSYIKAGIGIQYMRIHQKFNLVANEVFFSDPTLAYSITYGRQIFNLEKLVIDFQGGIYKKGFSFKVMNVLLDSSFRLRMNIYSPTLNIVGKRSVFVNEKRSRPKWKYEIQGGLQTSYFLIKKWYAYGKDESSEIKLLKDWEISALLGFNFVRIMPKSFEPNYAIGFYASYGLTDLYNFQGSRHTFRSFGCDFMKWF